MTQVKIRCDIRALLAFGLAGCRGLGGERADEVRKVAAALDPGDVNAGADVG